nr:proteasome subunit beta type-2-a [Quercus suber]
MVSRFRVSSKSLSAKEPKQASSPPRGWNSYDSFSWTISQEEFLQNAEIISERLLPHKYKYVVVDYLWHRRKVKGAYPDSLGFDVLKQLDRPIIVFTVSWNRCDPINGQGCEWTSEHGDDWDTWGDVAAHFNITRDLSTANMIGAKGLMGKSWPDSDMLPLGWLTDPGSNEGPHRTSRLLPDEQRTQMTLWSMAKSPLMFGGDVRKLDGATYNLLTNPTLLEINSFSLNNMEFPYITSTKNFKSIDGQSGRYLTDVSTSDTHVLSLTSCTNSKAIGWSIKALDQNLEQICWKEHLGSKHQEPFCLYKKEPQFSSDEWMFHKQQYQGKLQLFATDRMEFCLGGSPNQKLTSKELKSGAFAPCRWHTNQMWELSVNGTLANSYSGLCATVNSIKAEVRPGGTRSWIATGRKGEIYVAFSNLNPERTVISAKISDMAKVLPGKNFNGNSCQCKEVWSGNDIKVRKQTISRGVKAHGCALFVLKCNGFAIVVADSSAVHSILVHKSNEDKIMVLDSHKLIAASGEAGDRFSL